MTCVSAGPQSLGAGDFAGLDAGGASVDLLRGAIDHRAYRLDIGIPATLGPPMGVGDVMTETGSLAANIALRSHVTRSNELGST